GCGIGSITALLGRRELLYGFDMDAAMVDYVRDRFRDRPECRFERHELGRMPEGEIAALRALRFDSAICDNVLEHIEDDVGALRSIASLLEPGATLALLVPAHQALYGRYDAIDGHVRRYNKRSVRRLLEAAGFEPQGLRYFNVVGAVGWWVQYKLLRRSIH